MKPNEIIRQQRERLGLTPYEVAQKVGMSEKGYRYIESGQRGGTHETLFGIAQVLDLPVDAISRNATARHWWPAPGLNLTPPVPFDNATPANAEDTAFAKSLACLVLD